jgi:hypothetical protein
MFDSQHNKYIKYLCDYISDTEIETDKNIKYIVVGDVHGSILQLFMPLKQARIIDEIRYDNETKTFSYVLNPNINNSIQVIYCGDFVGRAKHSLTVPMLITFCDIYNDVVQIVQPTDSETYQEVNQDNKIVWVYGNHDIGFFRHFIFNRQRTCDVFNSEYLDILTNSRKDELINKLLNHIKINPYPCLYYNNKLNIQVSHTFIPLTYSDKNKQYGIDILYPIFKPTINIFKELFESIIDINLTKYNNLIDILYNYYKLPYSNENGNSDKFMLELVDKFLNKDEFHNKILFTKEDYINLREKYNDNIKFYNTRVVKINNNIQKGIDIQYNKYILKDANANLNRYKILVEKVNNVINSFNENAKNINVFNIISNLKTNKHYDDFNKLNIAEQINFINDLAKYVVINDEMHVRKMKIEYILYWFRPDMNIDYTDDDGIIDNYYYIDSNKSYAEKYIELKSQPKTKYFIGHSVIDMDNVIDKCDKHGNINIDDIFEKSFIITYQPDNSNFMNKHHIQYIIDTYDTIDNLDTNNSYSKDETINKLINSYNRSTFERNKIIAVFIKLLMENKIYNDILLYSKNYYKSRSFHHNLQDKINNTLFMIDIGATYPIKYRTKLFDDMDNLNDIANTIKNMKNNVSDLNQLKTFEVGMYKCGFAIGMDDGSVKSSKIYLF